MFREDYPRPKPGKGEALLKVTMAGICNTDLEILKGYMGFTGNDVFNIWHVNQSKGMYLQFCIFVL